MLTFKLCVFFVELSKLKYSIINLQKNSIYFKSIWVDYVSRDNMIDWFDRYKALVGRLVLQ